MGSPITKVGFPSLVCLQVDGRGPSSTPHERQEPNLERLEPSGERLAHEEERLEGERLEGGGERL